MWGWIKKAAVIAIDIISGGTSSRRETERLRQKLDDLEDKIEAVKRKLER